MFDSLGGPNECGIQHGIVAVFIDDLLAFLDEAFHCFADLAARFLAQPFENLFEPVDVPLGLFQVILKCPLQLRGGSFLGHFRQRLHQLVLGVVEVFQFIDVQVFQRIHTHK